MGTNVLAFCKHNFPTNSGAAMLKEFEARFNCQCHWLTETSENNHVPGRWRVLVYDHGTPELEWAKTNNLEFDRPAEDSPDETGVTFWGPLAELEDNNWSDWRFFVNTFIDLSTADDANHSWRKYRENTYALMKKVGGERVLFVGDNYSESLLFALEKDPWTEDEPDVYPTFEQMIELARKEGLRVFYHPVTADQLKGIDVSKDYLGSSILIDDFQDLKLIDAQINI